MILFFFFNYVVVLASDMHRLRVAEEPPQAYLMCTCNGHVALQTMAASFLTPVLQAALDQSEHSVEMLASQFTWPAV